MTNLRPAGRPRDNPAVQLELQQGPTKFPPGFYGSIRRRLPIFALVGAISVLAGLIPFPHGQTVEILVAGAVFFALTITALFLPWSRMPEWFWPVLPLGYIGVIALIIQAQGGTSAGLVTLFFLPIVWLAFYGRTYDLVLGLIGVALALIVPILVIGAPKYPSSDWRLVIVTMVTASLVSFSFLSMVSRDRAYVADLSEQSYYAQQSAHDADESRDRLESLLRAAVDTALIGTDEHGGITFFSAGAEIMLGYRAEEVVGRRSIYDFMDADEMVRRQSDIDEMVAVAVTGKLNADGPGRLSEVPWTYVRRDGTSRRCAVRFSSEVGEARTGYVVVAIDVTEREQQSAEQERLFQIQREVTEALVEQNNRLRELTQMKIDVVATVSHELRTPLTSIRGFVELLLEEAVVLDDEQRRMLQTIDRNSLHLLHVADDLLADPGGGQGLRIHFVDLDLPQLAAQAIDAIATNAHRQQVTMSLESPEPVMVHGDPTRLHQLFGNLLSNAVKFTPAGGRIRVEVDTFGHFARINVSDDGPGIPEAERAQLFERFYRLATSTDQRIPGTGLGLAISKSIVEAHEGTVDIVDLPGWSTTFRVLLPLKPTPPSNGNGSSGDH
jgi:PAS domain S-box-containing protein